MSTGSITVVGAGAAGISLASALIEAEAARSVSVFGEEREAPDHPIFAEHRARYVFGVESPSPDTFALFLTAPDTELPEITSALAAQGEAPHGCIAFHMSAAHGTDILSPLHERGYELGVFHPLTLGPLGTSTFEGTTVATLGSPEATAVARRLARAMGCSVIAVPAGRRLLFHAATTLTTTVLPVLYDLTLRLMERAGVPSDEALGALVPLGIHTLQALERGDVSAALSGPLATGDVEGVALHLRAMDPEEASLYASIGQECLRLLGPALEDDARAAIQDQLHRYR